MQNYARVQGGVVVETFATADDIAILFPVGYFQPCGPGVVQGWAIADGVYIAPQVVSPDPVVAPDSPPEPHYVPLATIRDRVTAAGKWSEFATALDGLPADKRWHLLTLSDGVSPDDSDATALLTAVGCDPAVILAAE